MKFSDRVNAIVQKNRGINKKQLLCKMSCAAATLDRGLRELEKDGKVEVATLNGVLGNPKLVYPKGRVPKQVKESKTYYEKAETYIKKHGPTRACDLAKAIGIDGGRLPSILTAKNNSLRKWEVKSEVKGKQTQVMYGLNENKPLNLSVAKTSANKIRPKKQIEFNLVPKKEQTQKVSAPSLNLESPQEDLLQALIGYELERAKEVLNGGVSAYIEKLKGLHKTLNGK